MTNDNGVRFSPCLTTHVTVTIIRYFTVHFRPCVPRRIVSLLWSAPTSAGKPVDPHAPLWPASPENESRAITHLYSKRDKFVTIRCLCALSIQKYTSHIHVDDWPAHRAGLLWSNFFGQPGSVSKFAPFLWVKLWVGWAGRGYTEISRYFPASCINWVTLVTKKKLLYSLRF